MHKKVLDFNLSQRKDQVDLKAGDVVKVYRKIKEGDKERTQVFEGMIIAKKGGQSSSPMITVRKVSYNVGVELIIPIFSPSIEKIEVVKRAKVRRAKLYYVRGRVSKALRFKFEDRSQENVGKEENLAKEKVSVENSASIVESSSSESLE